MAYAELSVETPTIDGLDPTFTAATLTDGNMFRNTGSETVFVKNGGGGAVAVTVPTPGTVRGLDIEDKIVSVPAGEERILGRFDPGLYNQSGADAGMCYIEYDQITSVTVGVFR